MMSLEFSFPVSRQNQVILEQNVAKVGIIGTKMCTYVRKKFEQFWGHFLIILFGK